jgi:hypothetical protein
MTTPKVIMLHNIIGCYLVITQLSAPLELPADILADKMSTCNSIVEEAYKQANEDILDLILTIAWQESAMTRDAKGTWLCTGKNTVSYRNKKPYCKKGTLTRARGPMQVLPVYHCKGDDAKNCNYIKVSVRLLSDLITQYGDRKGIEIYAGGFNAGEMSKRYVRRTLRTAKKVKKVLEAQRNLVD